MNKPSGFTLVIVLIITSIASVVVLSTLSDSVNQERLSGNFQKKLNAKLMSEKGIYTSMKQLQDSFSDEPNISLSDLVSDNASISGKGTLLASKFNSTVELDNDGNILVISQGKRFEGEANMQAVFEFIPATEGSTPDPGFPTGVVSCSDVDYGGHTAIDSYDSRLGDYDDLVDGTKNSGKDVIVTLLGTDGGEVKLQGSKSAIRGDVISVGDLTIDARTITGNVFSNGNLTIKGNQTNIGGDASAYIVYTQKNKATVQGDVTANSLDSEVDKKATVNGTINFGAGLVEKIVITNTNGEETFTCDSLNLRQEVETITPEADLPDLDVGSALTLGSKQAVDDTSIKATPSVFLDVATDIYYFDKVKIKKGELKIAENSNVVMFVDDDFSLEANGIITIPENSSLTLIVKGKVKIKSNSEVNTPTPGVTDDGRPVFSIYSAHEDGTGVELSGGHKQVYAVIYAPYTKVSIKSNAAFKGTILAGELDAKGGGAIHFDTALSESSFGGTTGDTSGSAGKLVFKQWVFSPDNSDNYSDDESENNNDDDDDDD